MKLDCGLCDVPVRLCFQHVLPLPCLAAFLNCSSCWELWPNVGLIHYVTAKTEMHIAVLAGVSLHDSKKFGMNSQFPPESLSTFKNHLPKTSISSEGTSSLSNNWVSLLSKWLNVDDSAFSEEDV